MPIMALGSGGMLSIAMAIAVTAAATSRHAGSPAIDGDQPSGPSIAPPRAADDQQTLLEPDKALTIDIVRGAIDERLPAIRACLAEWSARTQDTEAAITFVLRATEAGSVVAPSMRGLDDRIVPTCLESVLRDVRLPPHRYATAAEVSVTYVEGQTQVTARILGTKAPDPAE